MKNNRPPMPGPSCCKRKQPDRDEESRIKKTVLWGDAVKNEFEGPDTDEDDEEEEKRLMDQEKNQFQKTLKAERASHITEYDGIKVTPFNLTEEREEGEFDSTGDFIFKKDSPTDPYHNDTWAESIDWSEVERKERETKEKEETETLREKPKQSQPEPIKDVPTCYKQMLRIMKSGETVQKAIRRLGNDVPKRRPTKSKANKDKQYKDTQNTIDVDEARRKLDLMIEFAHYVFENGDTSVYQKSYDDLEDAIN